MRYLLIFDYLDILHMYSLKRQCNLIVDLSKDTSKSNRNLLNG